MTITVANGYAILAEEVARTCRPRLSVTVSQWADAHRQLSQKASAKWGQWKTERTPYLREPMDALSARSHVQRLVFMKSAQIGATELGLNWIGYVMHHNPGPMLIVVPTLDLRRRWVRQRLNPLIGESDVLRELVDTKRSRDASNGEDMKDFPGGMLILSGANSPASLSSMPIAYVLLDEVDRFPWEAGQEGDPVGLIQERTKAFPTQRKIVLISTPTVAGASRIEMEYNASDQRRYHVPCTHCGELQHLKLDNLSWNRTITEARYICEHCGAEMHEHEKTDMLREQGHGGQARWVPANPESEIRGYHINGLYAPPGLGFTWREIAREFMAVKDDPSRLKRFVNTTLGETWEDRSTSVEPHELLRRVEDTPMRTVPPGCVVITAGIDVQDTWLEVKLLGWGWNAERNTPRHWIIDRHQILGDTSRMEPWDQLQEYLHTPLTNSHGRALRIRAAGMDTRGHRGEQVRAFVMRPQLKVPVYAVQGATVRMHRAIATTPSNPDKRAKGKPVRGGFGIWNVGTEYCKDFIYGHLASDRDLPPEDRVFRFPAGLEEDYFYGLMSETFDPEKRRYIQRRGAKYKRNEPLDTLVYAWAIGHHREVMIGLYRNGRPDPNYFERLAAVLEVPKADHEAPETMASLPESTAAAEPAAPRRRRRKNYVNRYKE